MSYWSVVQTEALREDVAAMFLKQARFETYLPKIATKRKSGAPLFPSYLFVEIVDRWYAIRWTVGVLRLLMVDDRPAQVADKVITAIRRREGEDGLIRLPKLRGLRRGDPVQVVRGLFAGRHGLYDGMSGSDRSRVLLEMLGGKVPVSLPRGDVVAVETVSKACV